LITSLRQRDLLRRAAAAIDEAIAAARGGAGEEFWILDLRAAIDRLAEITGAVTTDDLHRRIFSTFCIGK
jgi:tRNA modification GTPase